MEQKVEQRISKDIETVVFSHADRLGIPREVALENAMKFAETVGIMENSGKLVGFNKPQAGKPKSSAKGLYQFLDGSVGPAKVRLGRHTEVGEIPDDPNEMSWDQQTSLFLADVLEKTAVVNGEKKPGLGDELMKKVLQDANDTAAVRDAYYILHHTKPDERTKAMAEGVTDGT